MRGMRMALKVKRHTGSAQGVCKINELRSREAKTNDRGPCPGEIYGHCPAKRFSIALVKLPTKNDIAYYMETEMSKAQCECPRWRFNFYAMASTPSPAAVAVS